MAAGDPLDGPDGPTPPKPPTQDGIFDVAAVAADGGPSPKGKGAEYGPTDEEAAEGESDLNQYRFLGLAPRYWAALAVLAVVILTAALSTALTLRTLARVSLRVEELHLDLRSINLQADAVLDVHNPSRVHTLSVRELTCPVWMQADVSGDGVFKPEEYYLGTLLTSHTDDAPLVFKSGGRKRHAQTTRLVEGNATTVASLFNGHLVSPSVSFRCRLESTIHIWNVVPVHKRYDLNYNFDNAVSVSTEEEGVSDSNSTGHDSNAWSVSMEGLALQAPDRLDTLPLRSTLQFTFEPAHAMATLFRALAGHTKVYSVRLPEADYTIAVKSNRRAQANETDGAQPQPGSHHARASGADATNTTTLMEGLTLRTTDTVVTHADVTVDAALDGDVRVMLGVTVLVGCPMPQCLGNLPSLLTQLLPQGTVQRLAKHPKLRKLLNHDYDLSWTERYESFYDEEIRTLIWDRWFRDRTFGDGLLNFLDYVGSILYQYSGLSWIPYTGFLLEPEGLASYDNVGVHASEWRYEYEELTFDLAHNAQDSLFDEIVVYQKFSLFGEIKYRNHDNGYEFVPRDFLRLLDQHGYPCANLSRWLGVDEDINFQRTGSRNAYDQDPCSYRPNDRRRQLEIDRVYVDVWAYGDEVNDDMNLLNWNEGPVGLSSGNLKANNGHEMKTVNYTEYRQRDWYSNGGNYTVFNSQEVPRRTDTFDEISFISISAGSDVYALFSGEGGGLFDFTDPNVWIDIGFLGSNGEKLLVSDRGSPGPSWGVEVRHNVSLTAQQLDSLGGPVDWTIEGTVDKTGNDEYAVAWIERKDYRTVTQGDARVTLSSQGEQTVLDLEGDRSGSTYNGHAQWGKTTADRRLFGTSTWRSVTLSSLSDVWLRKDQKYALQNINVEVAKTLGGAGGMEITGSGAVDGEAFTLSVSNDETRPDIIQFQASFDHLGTELDVDFNGNEIGFLGSANGQLSSAVARKLALDKVDSVFTEDIPINAVAEWSDGGKDGGRSVAEVSWAVKDASMQLSSNFAYSGCLLDACKQGRWDWRCDNKLSQESQYNYDYGCSCSVYTYKGVNYTYYDWYELRRQRCSLPAQEKKFKLDGSAEMHLDLAGVSAPTITKATVAFDNNMASAKYTTLSAELHSTEQGQQEPWMEAAHSLTYCGGVRYGACTEPNFVDLALMMASEDANVDVKATVGYGHGQNPDVQVEADMFVSSTAAVARMAMALVLQDRLWKDPGLGLGRLPETVATRAYVWMDMPVASMSNPALASLGGEVYLKLNERRTLTGRRLLGSPDAVVARVNFEMDSNQSGAKLSFEVTDESFTVVAAAKDDGDDCYMRMQMCGAYVDDPVIKVDMHGAMVMGASQGTMKVQGMEKLYRYRFGQYDGSVMYLQSRADWNNQDLQDDVMGLGVMDMPDDARGANYVDMTMALIDFDMDDMVMTMEMDDYSKYEGRKHVPAAESDIAYVNSAVGVTEGGFPSALFTQDRFYDSCTASTSCGASPLPTYGSGGAVPDLPQMDLDPKVGKRVGVEKQAVVVAPAVVEAEDEESGGASILNMHGSGGLYCWACAMFAMAAMWF